MSMASSGKIQAHLRRRGLTLSSLPNRNPPVNSVDESMNPVPAATGPRRGSLARISTPSTPIDDSLFAGSMRPGVKANGASGRRHMLQRSRTQTVFSPRAPLAPVSPGEARAPAGGGRFRRQFRRGEGSNSPNPNAQPFAQLDGTINRTPRLVVNHLDYVGPEKCGLLISDLCRASPIADDAPAATQVKQMKEAERNLAKLARVLAESNRVISANDVDDLGGALVQRRVFSDTTELASYALDCQVKTLFHNPSNNSFEYWSPSDGDGDGEVHKVDIEENSSFSRVVEGRTVNYGSSLIMTHDAILDELKDQVKSILLIPLVNAQGELFGCLRAVNKTDPLESTKPAHERSHIPLTFTKSDEKVGHIIASHCVRQLMELEALQHRRAKEENDNRLLKLVQEVASCELESLTSLMKLIMNHACKILRADRCSLFLKDEKAQQLWSVVAQDTSERIVIPIDAGICGAVARTGEVVNVKDAYLDPRFNPQVDQKTGYRTKQLLAMPVVRGKGGKIIGVMQMLNKQDGGEFTTDDVRLLGLYCTFAGIGLHNSQTHQEVLQKEKLASTLLSVNRALSQELELDTLIKVIMQSARDLLNADRCTLFLIDQDRKELWSRLADGTQEIRIPLGTGVAGQCAKTGEIVNIADAYAFPKFNQSVDRATGYRTMSILACPIRDQNGDVVGVTQMINKKGGVNDSDVGPLAQSDESSTIIPFTEQDEVLIEAFSSHAALSLSNSNLYQKTVNMRNYLEGVLRSITDTVLTFDIQGKFLTCNNEAVLGTLTPTITSQTLKTIAYQQWVTEEENKQFRDAMDSVMDGSEEVAMGYEYEFTPHLGGAKPMKISMNYHIMPYRSAEGATRGVVVVLQDISPQRRMMQTLSRYMSAEKAQMVLSDSGSTLGGTDLKATVLFADMRNYTQFSQNLNGAQIVEILNGYFSHMTPFVTECQGIVDKYIGDAVMAVFGSPMPKTDDSIRACRAALRMSKAVQGYSAKRRQDGLSPVVDVGIGIATGPVVSGNIGTQARMEFTVIGHTVNLSSRIEGATKFYGVRVLVCDVTYAEVRKQFIAREVDYVKLVGVQEPMSLYELMAERDGGEVGIHAGQMETLPIFSKGLKLYRAQQFAAAKSEFEKCLVLYEADKVSKMYVERCDEMISRPPAEDWDGSYTMQGK